MAAIVMALSGAAAHAQPAAKTTSTANAAQQAAALKWTNHRIQRFQASTWRWQSLVGAPRSRSSYRPGSVHSVPYAKWVLKVWQVRSKRAHAQARRWMQRQTSQYVAQLHSWSQIMGMSWLDRELMGYMSVEQRYDHIRKVYEEYEQRWNVKFMVNAFTCIHHFEGAWNANTGNGYYGGLQMDLPFQSRYGGEFLRRWGTADNWPVWAQLQASIRAYRSGRGFAPWPNTARACKLL